MYVAYDPLQFAPLSHLCYASDVGYGSTQDVQY